MADTKSYGLNDYGFAVPSLDTLVAETKAMLISAFGETFNTQSNSVVDKLTTILNEREYQLILLAASIYTSGTLAGAEGIYLDELLGQRGIIRRGRTRSSGLVEMTVNNTVPYSLIYTPSSFTIDNGNYVLASNTTVAGRVIGQRILNSDLVLGTYAFQIVNSSTNELKTLTLTLLNKTPGSTELNTFLYAVKNFIVTNTTGLNEDLIYIDSQSGALYIGYDSDKNFVGLNSRVDFRSSPIVGNRTLSIELVAVNPGPLYREANTITQISPTPSGFVSLTNRNSFSEGSDVETDNEYKLRAASIRPEASKATRPAIISALFSVDGVQKVKIFSNNTDEVDQYGVPAYRFEPVVYGGVTEDISYALYETIALSNNTYGNTFMDVPTEDGQIERIYHSKANAVSFVIRVRYKGKALTTVEQEQIKRAIKVLTDNLSIADTVYNIQLLTSTSSSLGANRFTSLEVQIKKASENDSAFSSADLQLGQREVFYLDTDNIIFQQLS